MTRESAPEGAPLISPPASEDTDNVPAGVTTEHPGAAAFTALPEVERRQIARNWDLDDLNGGREAIRRPGEQQAALGGSIRRKPLHGGGRKGAGKDDGERRPGDR